MKKSKPNQNRRMTTRRSVVSFVEEAVTPKKGQVICSSALYAMYCKRAKRWGREISKKRFYRILENNGYHARPAWAADIYEGLTFTKGVLP